ncbi:MAG: DNA replication and repair protein RecF [Oscillospiraceae bacterium]|nr:DNA replication and repair protein RecF [Oscillospiraceae bacterium]
MMEGGAAPYYQLLRLCLRDFRCHAAQTFAFEPGLNVLRGANGTGKTSVLEAVGYLSTVRSFRRAPETGMIRADADKCTVRAEIEAEYILSGDPGRVRTLGASLGASRELRADGVVLESPRAMLGRLPSVVFAPEDIALAKDGPAERRRFLDILLSQLRPRYVAGLSRCRRLLRDKQQLLARIPEKPSFTDMLPEFDRRIAETWIYLTAERAKITERLNELAARRHAAVTDGKEVLSVHLITQAQEAVESNEDAEALFSALYARLSSRRPAELARRQCLTGPQRDDLELLLDGRPIRQYGSQGQLRTAALSLKLAQRDVFVEELGIAPLLLLDDVFSELDETRRQYLLENTAGGQTLLTTADKGELRLDHPVGTFALC